MAKKNKGKTAVAKDAWEIEASGAPETELVDSNDDWGTWGTSKKAAKMKKGKAAVPTMEDLSESEPGAAGRAPKMPPFATALSPARQKIFLRGISPGNLHRKRSSRVNSRASSLLLQPTDKSSERDNASVRTNPHPWDSSSNASRPSKPQVTRHRVESVSSSTSSDTSWLADGIPLSTSESARDSHESWEEAYSDDIAPSDSESASMSFSAARKPTSEGSLHVGNGNTTQRSTWSPDIHPPTGYFPPTANTGYFYPGHHPEYAYPVTTNPFTPYGPPPSPSIPVPPPSSSEDLNIGSHPLFTCTLGMMLIGLDLKFFPRAFTLSGETSLLKYMTTLGLSALQGPIMMIVDDWKPWYLQHLQKAFPRFPAKMLLSFRDHGALSELPFANERQELTCITEHISTDPRASESEESDHVIPLGSTQAICRSIFTWTTKDAMAQRSQLQSDMDGYEQGFSKALLRADSTSLIIIVNGSKKAISQKIISYYLKSDPELERWKRLADNLEWIYVDTHFLFTKWDRVWAAVKRNLQDRISESQGLKPSSPILQQTQQLHQDANTMMSLLEHLRIHQTALERFSLEISNTQERMDPGRYKLHQRIGRTHQLLSYYDMMATSMIGQQQNLLGLAFNVETVMQGQAVGRLNALAFIFLPMSFAASVFGMTTFTIDAKWYPVLALPLLCLTVVVAVAADRILAPRHMKSMKRPHEAQKSQPPADIESNKGLNFMASTVSRLKSAARRTHQRKKQVQFVIPKSTSENLHPANSDEELANTSWSTYIENSRANDLKKKLERLQQTWVDESSSESEKPIRGPQPPSPPLYMSPSSRTSTRPGILRTGSRTYTTQQDYRMKTSKKVDIDKQKIRQASAEERLRQAASYQEDTEGGPVPLTAEVLRKQQRRNQPTHSRGSTDSERDRNRSIAEDFSRRTQDSTTYSHGASERGHVPRAFIRESTGAHFARVRDGYYEERDRSVIRSFDEDYTRPVPIYPNQPLSRRTSSYKTTEPLAREEGRQNEPEATIRTTRDPLPRPMPETEATFIVDDQGVIKISPRSRVYFKYNETGSSYEVKGWEAKSDEAFLQRNKDKLLPPSQPGRSTQLASLTEEGSNLGNANTYI